MKTFTHLSLAHVSTLFAHDAVDEGSMVQSLDKSATGGVHKRVLQSAEQNPVELLHIMLIGSLSKNKRITYFGPKNNGQYVTVATE